MNLLLIWKDVLGSVRVNRYGYTGGDSRMFPRYTFINAMPFKHTLQGIITFQNSKNITQTIVDKLVTQRNIMVNFSTIPISGSTGSTPSSSYSPKFLGYDTFTYHSGKLGSVPWTRAGLGGWKVSYAYSLANVTNPLWTQFPSGYTVEAGKTYPINTYQ